VRTLAVVLALITAFSGWQFLRRHQNEERLGLVATALAGREVGVSCPGFWSRLVEITPYAGWVAYDEHGNPADETQLSGSTCKHLEKLWRRDPAPDFACVETGVCSEGDVRAIDGMLTLAHEAWHLRGVKHEAQTQCYALQTVEAAARAIGLGEPAARRVATFSALRDLRLPQGDYRDPERCRPGGEFDLHPETPAWPG